MRHMFAVASLALLGAQAGGAGAEDRAEPPSPPVIRISVEMIRLDAVVTDKRGRHVTDLQPGDFEILQDGKPQPISHLSYVPVRASGATVRATPSERAMVVAPPAAVVAAAPPPRTIVFVIDDLSLSTDAFDRTRRALKRTVDGLDPADRVAVVTTARGLRSFALTTNRKENRDAIATLRRTPWTRDELGPLLSSQSTFFSLQQGPSRFDGGSFEDWGNRLALQSIAVVKQVINSLHPLPGRKALVLVSEGFAGLNSLGSARVHDLYGPLDRLYGDTDDVLGAWRRLGDSAARAAVVIDAVDPRGLVTGGLNADAVVSDSNAPGRLADLGLAQRLYLQHGQASLQYLTDETGGLALLDRNDLAGAFSSILTDLSGYYLIGYEPAQGTFGESGFHKIDVKVKRPGLHVRTRKGFYAVTDEQVATALQQKK